MRSQLLESRPPLEQPVEGVAIVNGFRCNHPTGCAYVSATRDNIRKHYKELHGDYKKDGLTTYFKGALIQQLNIYPTAGAQLYTEVSRSHRMQH
jgi:uncharacterized circularly permuted ATP-grasp superfamily protein